MDEKIKNLLSDWNGQTENRKKELYNDAIRNCLTQESENAKFRKAIMAQLNMIDSLIETLNINGISVDPQIIDDYNMSKNAFESHNLHIVQQMNDVDNNYML